MSDSTEGKDQHEPSMEEILASIRRIISEDGDGGEGGEAAEPAKAEATPPAQPAAAVPVPAAEPSRRPLIADVENEGPVEDDSDILLLTEEAEDQIPPPPPPSRREVRLALEDDEPPPPEPPRREPEALSFEPEPEPLRETASVPEEPIALAGRLLSERAAAASLASMSELVSRSHRQSKIESLPMGNASQTIEDITRELLRPLLKSWLDDNLPEIVERIVREEIGRLAIDAQRR